MEASSGAAGREKSLESTVLMEEGRWAERRFGRLEPCSCSHTSAGCRDGGAAGVLMREECHGLLSMRILKTRSDLVCELACKEERKGAGASLSRPDAIKGRDEGRAKDWRASGQVRVPWM